MEGSNALIASTGTAKIISVDLAIAGSKSAISSMIPKESAFFKFSSLLSTPNTVVAIFLSLKESASEPPIRPTPIIVMFIVFYYLS